MCRIIRSLVSSQANSSLGTKVYACVPYISAKLASQLCLRLLLKPRAFVSQIVIDFVDSQPNVSGELGAVAHPLVDTGEET